MKLHVFTTRISASAACGVSSYPSRESMPIITSLSTRFFGHPRLTNPTFVLARFSLIRAVFNYNMRAVPPHRASHAASAGDSSVGFRSFPRFVHHVLHGLDDHFLRNRRMRRVGHNDLPPTRRKPRQFRLN